MGQNQKKFIAGVANTYNYSRSDELLWVGKTLLNSSIEISVDNEEARAGQGNQLHFIYYHSGEMNITQEDQQWNLTALAKNVGSNVEVGGNVWKEENIELENGEGEVSDEPVESSADGETIYGWAELEDGSTERFTFSGNQFSLNGQDSGTVCVRYYTHSSAARKMEIGANMIPDVVRTVMEAQLFSGDPQKGSSTKIGTVQVEIPRLQLNGEVSIELESDGISSTPIEGMALASKVSGCAGDGVYATVSEVIEDANWYDNVNDISIVDSDFTIDENETKQLEVYAIPNNGDSPFIAPKDELTYVSDDDTVATVSSTGEVEGASAGDTTIVVSITEKEEVTAVAKVTVET